MSTKRKDRRKLAAIMFTDMVGYSALMQRDESLALDLLEEHRRFIRATFPEYNGSEANTTGDGFLIEFPSALEATECAIAIQNKLFDLNGPLPASRKLQIRIGVHVGDVIVSDGTVVGDAVNIAARIEPLAAPGGVCISNAVYDQVRNKVNLPLVKVSAPDLKNIRSPIDVYHITLPWQQAEARRKSALIAKTFEQDEMPPLPPTSSRKASSPSPRVSDRMPGPAQAARPAFKGALANFPTAVLGGVDRTLGRLLGEYASVLRSNKPLLFGLAGFFGAALGALVAEAVPHFQMANARAGESLYTALYSGVAASVLTPALWLAAEYHRRRVELTWGALVRPFLSGALAGILAGALAGFMYGSAAFVEYWREILFRPICWGAMGGLLGWRLSSMSPNLGISRGLAGGLIGGAVGGFAFLFTAILFPQFIGRIVGFGVMGAALGLALVAVDALFREAILEVVWAPNETTSIPLGPRPTHIGGGDDHVSIPGLAENAISITLEGGRIRFFEKASGRKTDLKDGSNIKIGRVALVIHARQAASKAASRPAEER